MSQSVKYIKIFDHGESQIEMYFEDCTSNKIGKSSVKLVPLVTNRNSQSLWIEIMDRENDILNNAINREGFVIIDVRCQGENFIGTMIWIGP